MAKDPLHTDSSSWTGTEPVADRPQLADRGGRGAPITLKTLFGLILLAALAESYNSYDALVHHMVYANGAWIDQTRNPALFAYAAAKTYLFALILQATSILIAWAWYRQAR